MRIGIEHDNDVAVSAGKPKIDGSGLPAVPCRDERNPRIVGVSSSHYIRGAIGGAVINDEDLNFGMVARQDPFDRGGDNFRLVECWNEN